MNTKTLLYAPFLSLLASCGMFSSFPPKVLEGQKGVYQGITILEENSVDILSLYEQDSKALVAYHANFVCETKMSQLVSDQSISDEERSKLIAELQADRDEEIRSAFAKIEEKRQSMGKVVATNAQATRKLVEAVYGYMSSTPIAVEDVDFWIQKMIQVTYGRK
jgi:hypothetical protein